MQKTMTITLDETVYDGLMNVIGSDKVSGFIETLRVLTSLRTV